MDFFIFLLGLIAVSFFGYKVLGPSGKERLRIREERDREEERKQKIIARERAIEGRIVELSKSGTLTFAHCSDHPKIIKPISCLLECSDNTLTVTAIDRQDTTASKYEIFDDVTNPQSKYRSHLVLSFAFEDMVSCKELRKDRTASLYEEGDDKIGRALVGGLLAGGAGAVVGAVSGKDSRTQLYTYMATIGWELLSRDGEKILICTPVTEYVPELQHALTAFMNVVLDRIVRYRMDESKD